MRTIVIRPLVFCLFLALAAGQICSVAHADSWQLEEDGDFIHIGGINSLDGVSFQTRTGLDELKTTLEGYGYVSLRTCSTEDVNRLFSANNTFWFMDYTWYPYDASNCVVYVNPTVFSKAVSELRETPELSDLLYEELLASTCVVTYLGVEAVEQYGTVYDKYNEALVAVWEESIAYGSDFQPEYVILSSPIACDVVLTIQSTLRVYHFTLQANQPLRVLLFDQCYLTYLNGVDVSAAGIQTPSYTYDENATEESVTLDLSDVISEYQISERELSQATPSFSMGFSDWVSTWTNAERGSGYVKPTWGKDSVTVNTEPYVSHDTALDPSEESSEEEVYDVSMYFSSETTTVAQEALETVQNQTKKKAVTWILLVLFGLPLLLTILITLLRTRRTKKERSQ